MRFLASYTNASGEIKDIEFDCCYDNRFSVQKKAIEAIKEAGGKGAEPVALGRGSQYPDLMLDVSRIDKRK